MIRNQRKTERWACFAISFRKLREGRAASSAEYAGKVKSLQNLWDTKVTIEHPFALW